MMNEVTEGQRVQFRPDFSGALIGLDFEVAKPSAGRPLVSIAHESQGGYEFVAIRRRVGKAQRWAYRLARLSDLIPA